MHIIKFVLDFEYLYYRRDIRRLHFIRPCIHALVHIVPEIFRVSSLKDLSQYVMEWTIGNLGEEIHLHSDSYRNVTQQAIEQAQEIATKAMFPFLMPIKDPVPTGALDLGHSYYVLGPRELVRMEKVVLKAFKKFVEMKGWEIHIADKEPLSFDCFACLCLPNQQEACSLWQEEKREDEEVRRARNVKVS